MKRWITHRCAHRIMYSRCHVLLFLGTFFAGLFFQVKLFFFDRTLIFLHFLDKLFNAHLRFFTWILNWGNHFLDLKDGGFDGFTFPFIELSTQNIKWFSKFLHGFGIALFKLKNLLNNGWKLRELIAMFLVDEFNEIFLHLASWLLVFLTVFFTTFYQVKIVLITLKE